MARAFQERGAPAIRFNFRGVGASARQLRRGPGETEDALAVIELGAGARWPQAALWLGGLLLRRRGRGARRRAGAAGARCSPSPRASTKIDVRRRAARRCVPG